MRPIKVVIFDDNIADLNETKDNLELGWQVFQADTGRTLPDLEIEGIRDYREMTSMIKDGFNQRCIVFISDIIVDQNGDGKPERKAYTKGFNLLRRAKLLGVPVCVQITHGYSEDYALFETQKLAASSSVDLSWIKPNFYESGNPGSRAENIADLVLALRAAGALDTLTKSVVVSNEKEELRTSALVAEVGEDTVNAFAEMLAPPGAERCKLRVIAPGYSGAMVAQLEFEAPNESFQDRQLVVKISRDFAALKRELDACKRLDSEWHYVSNTVARPSVTEVQSTKNGWYAVAFRGVPSASTLLDWLDDASVDRELVEETLKHLYMRDGLTKMYKAKAVIAGDAIEVLKERTLPPKRQIGINLAIEELEILIKVYDPDGGWDRNRVKNFLSAGMVGSIPQLTKFWESRLALCHGDFHGRNLLVERDADNNRIRIIDLANMGENLWPTDIARLCVDLAVSGWDAGWRSYEWNRLSSWSNVIGALLGEAEPDDSGNKGVASALRWLRANALKIHGIEDDDIKRWSEYYLCVAVELLRASYRTLDLTAPKRALGLIGAARALAKVESLNTRNSAASSSQAKSD